jgi:YWFCY protein/Type IV secretory system Conjugative DNA transfer
MQPNHSNNYRELREMAGIISIAVLVIHFYYTCYAAFAEWHLTNPFVDRLVANFAASSPIRHPVGAKLIAYFFVLLTLAGVPPQTKTTTIRHILYNIGGGLALYLGSGLTLLVTGDPGVIAIAYIAITILGLALLYSSAKSLGGLLQWRLSQDIFNRYNESFPQEERWLKGPYVLHLRARYTFRNQTRDSVVNLLDIFRGTLIMGVAGSGKTRHVFRPLIQQSLNLGMGAFIFDLKYDDLSRLTYNTLLQASKNLQRPPAFYSINFDDLNRSHRCNPLDPAGMEDISDAAEMAKTILYALNRKWIGQQGDFFVDSAISFCTANIWFLRRYENGRYCTLPHLIELMQSDFYDLFSVLQSYPELETMMAVFTSALRDHTLDQLQGQVATARIALSTLASPRLYYLLSANDFTLDINDPNSPKVVCVGSNPQKQFTYGAVVSLIVTRLLKLVNRKGGVPCEIFLDEFPSFYAHGIHLTLAQARSNKVAVTLGVQDLSQLRMEYGRDHADAIFNLPANLICGQVSGDSARLVSERFGKILQEKNTTSTNSRDSSSSQSHQLDLAIPPSKISSLSSGEFVGMTADTPTQPIQLKGFHCHIPVDNRTMEKEEATWVPLPEIRTVTPEVVDFNFRQIKQQSRQIVQERLSYMASTPELTHLIVSKKNFGSNLRKSPGRSGSSD